MVSTGCVKEMHFRIATVHAMNRDWSAYTVAFAAALKREVTDQNYYLTQSQFTDAGLTSPCSESAPHRYSRLYARAPMFKLLVIGIGL